MDNVLGSIKNFSSPDVVRTRKVDVLNADGEGGEGMSEETAKKGKQLGTGMFIVGAILTYYIVYKILKG
jgi:hypothetical protein